jgi:hypothetical protein
MAEMAMKTEMSASQPIEMKMAKYILAERNSAKKSMAYEIAKCEASVSEEEMKYREMKAMKTVESYS